MDHTSPINAQLNSTPETAAAQFYTDVITGLRSTPKRLNSKYFYDAVGDKLFQELMACPEYYPTDCELEIFSGQTAAIVKAISNGDGAFDLVELGAGDATKSSYLLRELLAEEADFAYLPIDISSNTIAYLTDTLPVLIPGLNIIGLNGEYFNMLKRAVDTSDRRKVVMFLGSNIGNVSVDEAVDFCREIRSCLNPGDMVLIGIDLKKNPATILAAYNDKEGITKKFNLNLLQRINRELKGDFDLSKFEHYPVYDPETGACKSYLISTEDQLVTIGRESVHFLKDEYIFMEISQKYTVAQTNHLALASGFKTVKHFFDAKRWFVDAIWVAE